METISWVKNLGKRKWNITNILFKMMSMLSVTLPNIKLLAWWQYAQVNPVDVKRCRTIVKLLFDCHGLKSCLYKYKNDSVDNPYCDFCNNRLIEDPQHILFQCPENYEMRRTLWLNVKDSCPDALYQDIMSMTITDRVTFLFSGLGGWMTEWQPLFKTCLQYIHLLYMSRIHSK